MAKPAILHQRVFTISFEVDGPSEHRESWVGGVIRKDSSIDLGGILSQGDFVGFSRDVLMDEEREVLVKAVLVLLKVKKGTGAV